MRKYFATLDTPELIKECEKRIKSFNTYIETTGLAARCARSERLYFGRHQGEAGVGSYTIKDAGVDGEMSAVAVNKYRSMIKHNLSYTVTQKPAWDPQAKNSDTKSEQQARLAGSILNSYMTEKRMGRFMNTTAERAVVGGKAFTYMIWNPALGKPVIPKPVVGDDGQPVLDDEGQPKQKMMYEGDIECSAKGMFDVIYDPHLRDWSKAKWVIVREYENKWDLAARHPEQAEAIIEMSLDQDFQSTSTFSRRTEFAEKGDDDIIAVYHLYHLKSDGVASGRYTKFLNGKIGLYDGPMQYRRLPVFRMAPGDEFDTAEGYTDAFDQMMLQEALNVFYSVAFSNLQAFAGQKLWLPEGCEVSPSQVDDGMTILKGGVPGTEPRILNLTAVPPELLGIIELFQKSMIEGMGLNSVVTGDPDHGLKSGTALGKMQAMAIQYASNLQRSWAELQEDVGTFTIELLKDFAKSKRMIALAGLANRGAMAEFSGDDLDLIERVGVNLGNPAFRTNAGIMELAENLFQKGEITGFEYIKALQTGSLDSILEQKEATPDLVAKENELLRDGKPVQAAVGDSHLYHMEKHRAIYSDPTLRANAAAGDQIAQKIVQEATLHAMWHNYFYNTQEPIFSITAKEPPAPVRMMPDPSDMSNPNLDQSLPPPRLMPPPMPIPMGPPNGPNQGPPNPEPQNSPPPPQAKPQAPPDMPPVAA